MRIIGRSKALYGTWFFIPTYKLIFDCGDGAGYSLGIRSGDIEYICLSHMHLDHIAGIPTILRFQQRVLKGIRKSYPDRAITKIIHHPDHIEKIKPLKQYLASYYITPEFVKLDTGTDFEIAKNIYIRSFKVQHSATYYKKPITAVGYHLIEKRKRLKKKYLDKIEAIEKEVKKPKDADFQKAQLMVTLKKEKGKEELYEQYEVKLVSYCGDSTPVDYKEIMGTNILLHEATFLTPEGMEGAHSHIDDVLALAKKAKCKALVVYHISEKYKREKAGYKKEIIQLAKKKKLDIPVYVVGVDEFFNKDINVS